MRLPRKLTAAVLSLSILSGCNADGTMNKQLAGAGIGGALGGLVGNQFGKGSGKGWMTALGVIGGALLGSEIGKMLDENDRRALAQAQSRALATARDGETTQWQSASSGASATIKTAAAPAATKPTQIVRKVEVQRPTQIDLIGETYAATAKTPVYANPAKGKPLETLAANEQVTAVGRVAGGYVLVSRQGKAIGYVADASVKPLPAAAQAAPTPVDLDAAPPAGAVKDEVVATAPCRTVETTVTVKGSTSAPEKSTVCKKSDGTWDLG